VKQILTIVFLFLFISNYAQDYNYTLSESSNFSALNYDKMKQVVEKAKQFYGVRYRYGGGDKNGMDCSGLICTAYNSIDVNLPRSSSAIAQQGEYIEVDYLQVGDLMFFQGSTSNSIGHVAMVSKIENGSIYIVHATTSRGVIEEKLENNSYFMKRWLYNKRIITSS